MKETNWYTKKQVAEIFGCSVKSVERWVKAEKLNPTFVVGKFGKQAMFNPQEVEKLKELEDTLGIDRSTIFGQVQVANNPPTLITQSVNKVLDPLNTLVECLKSNQVVPPYHKLMLSLKEAQALSGLSRNQLREAIDKGTLKAQIIGKGWKVKRKDLENFVDDIK